MNAVHKLEDEVKQLRSVNAKLLEACKDIKYYALLVPDLTMDKVKAAIAAAEGANRGPDKRKD